MKNVIVTGANGFIGSSFTKKLIENGVHVVAIDLNFANFHVPDGSEIIKIETQIIDAETLEQKIPDAKYDAFYHFAWRGVNGMDKVDPIIQLQNAQMAMVCAKVANQCRCSKFLCAGTIAERAVESLPRLESTSGGMMYGVAKYCTHMMLETYCKNIGQDFVWMQFSNIYGPNNKTGNLVSYTIGQLTKSEEATFGPAMQPYDFIYVDDLLEAAYRLGEKPTARKQYFIGSGKPRILRDYLLEIGECFGRPDLIRIGARPDDGIVYAMDMFDTEDLIAEVGDYISGDFSVKIRETIKNYGGGS